MARLIDADELNWRLGVNQKDKQIFYATGEDIDAAPTIDLESLRAKAHWMYVPDKHGWMCTKCQSVEHYCTKFCPHCGAKMED